MSGFFDQASYSTTASHGSATFELPIRYHRDDCFALYFSADANAVRATLPSDHLYPVLVGNGRALAAVVAFNYVDTSIGPYGEVAVGVPVVYGHRPPRLLPALRESAYPGFGVLVLHLPVTRQVARDAGRGEWGYTKFVADMRFDITPEELGCELSEGSEHILTLRVGRGGLFARDDRPICTYSVKDRTLIRTVIPQIGAYRWWPSGRGSSLVLGRHPLADTLRRLDLSPPIMKRYYVERAAILPAGEVAERGVRALDGHLGRDGDGLHEVRYPGAEP